jgi:hypothetical protein
MEILVEGVCPYTPPRVLNINNHETRRNTNNMQNSLPIPRIARQNPLLPRIFHHKARTSIQER